MSIDKLLSVADSYLSSRVVAYPSTEGEIECSNALDAIVKARKLLAAPTGALVAVKDEQQHGHVMAPFAPPASQHEVGVSAWISVDEHVPSGKNCLAVYENRGGSQFIIRARYVERFAEEATGDDCYSEINDADDTDYLREGWYELIDNWGEYSSVNVCEGVVTHWMPLPLTPYQRQIAGSARQGGNTNNNGSPEFTATTAPGDLPPLVRYEPANGRYEGEDAKMFPYPSGAWVKFADVQACIASNAGAAPLVQDLAMLVRRLVRRLEKDSPGADLAPQALDFLRRKGLQGSPLRTDAFPSTSPVGAKEKE